MSEYTDFELQQTSLAIEHRSLTHRDWMDKAVNPNWRGRKLTTRKVLNLESNYFWKDVPCVPIPNSEDIPTADDDGLGKFNCGLVNIYFGAQGKISSHTDSKLNMVVETGVYSISYGYTSIYGAKDSPIGVPIPRPVPVPHGTKIGSFWMNDVRQDILSGVPFIFDGYNIKHRASTKANIIRFNITLRHKK